MRILQVSDLYPPCPGGMELAVATISAELARRGHQVEVLTQAGPAGAERDGAGGARAGGVGRDREERDGVTVRRVAGLASRADLGYADQAVRLHPPAPDPWIVAALRRSMAQLQPDVVHAHGWIAHSVLAALPRRGGPLAVVGVHDYSLTCAKKTAVDRHGRDCAGPALARCARCAAAHYGPARGLTVATGMRLAAPLYRRADVLVANSRAVAATVAGAHGPGRPEVEVIPPPVRRAPAGCARPDFLPPDDGFVMFAGALAPHKGLDVLLEAHQRFGLGAPLVVLGPARHDSPRRWPAGVTVVPGVAHDQVLAAWRHASVAAVPSIWAEPFGMVAAEALAAGVPVVASATGGLVDIVDDGVSGLLVRPGDVAGLAAALRRLTGDREEARRMGAAGAAGAGRFSVERVAYRLEELYRRPARRR